MTKDEFLLNIMTLWTEKGKTHYYQCWTNNNTRNGSASQMGELFRECLFNLGIMSTSSLIQVHQDHILFHGLFGLYDPFGTSPVLRSTANRSFHPGHIHIYKVSNIWIQHIFNHCFFGPFLIPFKGYSSISLLLPLFTYVKINALSFSFSMGTYKNL